MYNLLSDAATTQDRLGFDPMAKILKDVILNTAPPFTIGVFGEWGSGKTTLMKLVEAKLEAQNSTPVKTVWFNAWRYEGKDVIWNALIQTVFLAMREDEDVRGEPELLARVTQAATNLAFLVAKKTASIVTGGVVDGDTIDELRTSIEPLTANGAALKFINTFETEFAEIVKAYVGDQGRLVIFVDDLDRCLPENAVQVLEAIKLYLDSANVTFVIGVEPEVVRTGIKHRYKDNATLAEKEYLEKIVQLPFVMRGLDRDAAMSLIRPYAKTQDYFDDEMIIEMILTATETNPRRIKRFINTFYVLVQMHLASGGSMDPDDLRRLALTLLTQMRFHAIYELLVDQPGLIKSYKGLASETTEDRDKILLSSVALKTIYEDRDVRKFFDLTGDLDCSEDAMKPWVLFARGEDR